MEKSEKTRKIALLKVHRADYYDMEYQREMVVDQSDWEEVSEDDFKLLLEASKNHILNPYDSDYHYVLIEKPNDVKEKIKFTVKAQIEYAAAKKKEQEEYEQRQAAIKLKRKQKRDNKEKEQYLALKAKYETNE